MLTLKQAHELEKAILQNECDGFNKQQQTLIRLMFLSTKITSAVRKASNADLAAAITVRGLSGMLVIVAKELDIKQADSPELLAAADRYSEAMLDLMKELDRE